MPMRKPVLKPASKTPKFPDATLPVQRPRRLKPPAEIQPVGPMPGKGKPPMKIQPIIGKPGKGKPINAVTPGNPNNYRYMGPDDAGKGWNSGKPPAGISLLKRGSYTRKPSTGSPGPGRFVTKKKV